MTPIPLNPQMGRNVFKSPMLELGCIQCKVKELKEESDKEMKKRFPLIDTQRKF